MTVLRIVHESVHDCKFRKHLNRITFHRLRNAAMEVWNDEFPSVIMMNARADINSMGMLVVEESIRCWR